MGGTIDDVDGGGYLESQPCPTCGRPTAIALAKYSGRPTVLRPPPPPGFPVAPTGFLGYLGPWYEQKCTSNPPHRRLLDQYQLQEVIGGSQT